MGHKEKGKRMWTWVFRSLTFTFFRISESRGSKVLIEVLGKQFDGVLGCDYFSAYRKYMRLFDAKIQFCMAHLIRDVKFLVDQPDPQTKAYGTQLRAKLRSLFRIIHRRDSYQGEDAFRQALDRARQRVLETGLCAPDTKVAQNMARRFRLHGESYFTFITTPQLDPTNNLAEQAIRFVVIDRHITQGTRGIRGRHWSERIWTTTATLARQGASVFEFLEKAILANFARKPPPSLIPGST
jgi:hypothetical protein